MATKKEEQEERAKKKLGRNQQIIGSLRAEWNARQVAEVNGLSYSWSKKLCSRLRKGDSGERKPGSRRPRKTTVQKDRFLIKEATRQRDAFDNCPRTAYLAAHLPKYHVGQLSAAFMKGIIKKVSKNKKTFC